MFTSKASILVAWFAGAGLVWGDAVSQAKRAYGLGEAHEVATASAGARLATGGPSGAFLWNEAGQLQHRLEERRIAVNKLVFSPDGRTLLAGFHDGLIRAWNAETGEWRADFAAHRADINALDFTPDGRVFASASGDNTVRLWSFDTGEIRQTMKVPGCLFYAATFIGDALATADNAPTNRVKLWDIATGQIARTIDATNGQTQVLASLPPGWLATGGDDHVVRLWNPLTGELVRSLATPDGVGSLAVLPGRTSLIAGCWDGSWIEWDYATGLEKRRGKSEGIMALKAGPGTNEFTIATPANQVQIRNLDTGLISQALVGHTSSTITGVAFSPDGQSILSGGVEAATRLWNRTNAALTQIFEGHGSGTTVAAFSPDGRQVLTTIGYPRKAARLYDAETGALNKELLGHTDWLTAAAFSADGRRVITAAQDRTARLWDAASGLAIQVFSGHLGWVASAALSPDGRLVAGGGSSFDPSVRVWEVGSGKLVNQFQEEAGSVRALAFSPSGAELMVGWEDGLVRVFELASGALTREILPRGFLGSAAYSPRGDFLLIGEGWPTFAARLWDVRTGAIRRTFNAHSAPVGAVAFNGAGNWILTGGDNVRLWDISDLAAQLQIGVRAGSLSLSWGLGALEQANRVGGPWQAVPQATSPWIAPAGGQAAFYRAAVEEEN
jgi:WD40 repeat protein